jgi:flagellar basal-body rod modification protein FlgD
MTMVSSVSDNQLYQDLGLSRTQETKNSGQLGQEDFLKLMVTQLKNQDPMKPMESGDFLTQIAQFGTVSGVQDLQKSFHDFSNNLFSSQTLEAASLIGREVTVPADQGIYVEGEGLRGAIDLPISANDVSLNVYSASGELVRTMHMGQHESGMLSFEWDGLDDTGNALPTGVYRVEAEARDGTTTTAADTYLNTQVLSVELGGDKNSMTLDTRTLGSVDFSNVRRIG